jgi:hypothetical protein
LNTRLLCTLQSCLGIAVSVLCAVIVANVFAKTHWKHAAPVLFAVVLVMLASRFGAPITVAGSLLGAAIFVLLLFSAPPHSLHLENESDRDPLAWMILSSVSLSYLLYPTRSGGDGSVPRVAAEVVSESAREPDAYRSPTQKLVGTEKAA